MKISLRGIAIVGQGGHMEHLAAPSPGNDCAVPVIDSGDDKAVIWVRMLAHVSI